MKLGHNNLPIRLKKWDNRKELKIVYTWQKDSLDPCSLIVRMDSDMAMITATVAQKQPSKFHNKCLRAQAQAGELQVQAHW